MLVFIIIVLFIAVLWFRSEASDANIELVKEKSKIENFNHLITLLKNSESGFTLSSLGNQRILRKYMGHNKYKMLTIQTGNSKIGVQLFFKGEQSEIKLLTFSIYDDISTIVSTVSSQCCLIEKTMLENNPNFWGKAVQQKSS